MDIKNQALLWEKHFEKGLYDENYPSEQVVRFLMRLSKNKERKYKVLDLGCGVGRHLILCAENGLNCYGLDIADSALKSAEKNLKKKNLNAQLNQGDLITLPYEDNFFDIIISFGVFDHVNFSKAKIAIKEVYRILKDDGHIYFKLETSDSPERGLGYLIGKNTYIMGTECEKNIIQHYFSKNEVLKLFENFEILRLEKEIIENELNNSLIISRWHIVCRKVLTE